MPENPATPLQNSTPDYIGLVKFLIEPFLESPESLSIDCERSPARARAWIRLAFEGADKGRVFGRGGRNIQAIRTVIQAAAQAVGESVNLDIYDAQGSSSSSHRDSGSGGHTSERQVVRPSSLPKPTPKPRP